MKKEICIEDSDCSLPHPTPDQKKNHEHKSLDLNFMIYDIIIHTILNSIKSLYNLKFSAVDMVSLQLLPRGVTPEPHRLH